MDPVYRSRRDPSGALTGTMVARSRRNLNGSIDPYQNTDAMAVLLYKLNHVPPDEADEVRALLTAHEIPFYETSAGLFGLSVAAIWLPDRSHWQRASDLLRDYHAERAAHQRRDYAERLARGEVDSFWQRAARQPLKLLLAVVALGVVLYVSIVPFLKGFG